MMSTGALIALGAVYIFSPEALPTRGVNQSADPELAPAPNVQPAVARASNDLGDISPIGQIEAIVAMSEAGLQREQEMTPEQLEVIAFFENTAREMNQTGREKSSDQVQFNNMAVDQLRVLYYYTVPARYDQLDHEAIMSAQADLVTDTLCQGEAIRTLMTDYGFKYSYTYVSSDLRKIGTVQADASSCES